MLVRLRRQYENIVVHGYEDYMFSDPVDPQWSFLLLDGLHICFLKSVELIPVKRYRVQPK